jgi:hypothetical protein
MRGQSARASRVVSLLLPATSLLEGQVDDGATGHVVVSQRVGILDEDALENRCRPWCGAAGLSISLQPHSPQPFTLWT